jgi:hypothetical protein
MKPKPWGSGPISQIAFSPDIDALQLYAGVHEKSHDLFRCMSKRFPFAIYYDVREFSGFIASDGFEILFEQDRSLDEFAQVFADIDFPEALPVFQKVKAVVPETMLTREYDSELREHLTSNFDRLKELLYEYFDVSNVYPMPAFGEFVRRHKDEFTDQLT